MDQIKKAVIKSNIEAELDPHENYQRTMELTGFVPRLQATPKTYQKLGFKCGLEIHQQLFTDKKLFCRCPAGLYQKKGDFDAEVIRHMRPTLSEMGEYDGTALMEKKTRKNITYHIKYETACTYDVDDTPPFKINRQALEIALEISLLLKTNVVGELHITRKQYLDGSIPTGFQRTAIVGIEGEIPISNKKIKIIQLSIEEDSCREISDIGHERVYTTDRLGMPLIEMVTYPEMLTPDEAEEAGQYLRYVARSNGKVRTGMGAGRQDVNVSINGGTRVEIKGVSHIKWIPELTHVEAFRQKALLNIQKILSERIEDTSNWKISHYDITENNEVLLDLPAELNHQKVILVSLPKFKGILSHFTQPGKTFANEISDRLKVIACLERPNMIQSEQADNKIFHSEQMQKMIQKLNIGNADASLIFWGPEDDIKTALETIEERCRLAFDGVPNETRKALADGTTIFERVLPGPDRMYPDTDSAPVSIPNDMIEDIRNSLPQDISERVSQLREWKIPADCYPYILSKNYFPLIKRIVNNTYCPPKLIGTIIGHTLKNLDGRKLVSDNLTVKKIYTLFEYISEQNINPEIIKEVLPLFVKNPDQSMESILKEFGCRKFTMEQLLKKIPELLKVFINYSTPLDPAKVTSWIMGQLRFSALGNVPLKELKVEVEKVVNHG